METQDMCCIIKPMVKWISTKPVKVLPFLRSWGYYGYYDLETAATIMILGKGHHFLIPNNESPNPLFAVMNYERQIAKTEEFWLPLQVPGEWAVTYRWSVLNRGNIKYEMWIACSTGFRHLVARASCNPLLGTKPQSLHVTRGMYCNPNIFKMLNKPNPI